SCFIMMMGVSWSRSEQHRRMRAACAHAHITPAVGFHALRHTWASLACLARVPLLVVARNLGHADTSTTTDIWPAATSRKQSTLGRRATAWRPNMGCGSIWMERVEALGTIGQRGGLHSRPTAHYPHKCQRAGPA